MSLLTTITRFAGSRQGRRMAGQAMTYARSPEGKRRVELVRKQLADRRKPRP